jgi:hypothetical protein
MPKPPRIFDPALHFWPFVDKKSCDECWIWNGTKMRAGYGGVFFKGKPTGAHRLSWMMANNRYDITRHMVVMHSCDNPSCVNPSHLRLGTYSDNNKEPYIKGRRIPATGSDHYTAKHPEMIRRGEQQSATKITTDTVLAIRRLYRDGEKQSAIASRFNVCQSLISLIVSGRRWSHLPL